MFQQATIAQQREIQIVFLYLKKPLVHGYVSFGLGHFLPLLILGWRGIAILPEIKP